MGSSLVYKDHHNLLSHLFLLPQLSNHYKAHYNGPLLRRHYWQPYRQKSYATDDQQQQKVGQKIYSWQNTAQSERYFCVPASHQK